MFFYWSHFFDVHFSYCEVFMCQVLGGLIFISFIFIGTVEKWQRTAVEFGPFCTRWFGAKPLGAVTKSVLVSQCLVYCMLDILCIWCIVCLIHCIVSYIYDILYSRIYIYRHMIYGTEAPQEKPLHGWKKAALSRLKKAAHVFPPSETRRYNCCNPSKLTHTATAVELKSNRTHLILTNSVNK